MSWRDVYEAEAELRSTIDRQRRELREENEGALADFALAILVSFGVVGLACMAFYWL